MTSVLVVDDDEQLRTALARELTENEFEVRVAQSVPEALEALAQRPTDVLLTDLRMSDQDGIDLLEQAQRYSRTTRAILMSAYATARDHQTAIELGAVRVLCKPFTSTELLTAIRQAVDCETGFRGSVHGLSLIDLLQMFHYGKRSISLRVGGVEDGEIHLDGGEIVHATHGDTSGEGALRSLLARPSGSIVTAPLCTSERSIGRSFQSLLLDVLRQLDEGSDEPDFDAAFGDPFESQPSGEEAPARAGGPDDKAQQLGPLSSGLRRLVPDATAVVVELSDRRVTHLAGSEPVPEDFADVLLAMVEEVEGTTPEWERIECVSGPIALGILKCSAGECVVAVMHTLVGRYANVKFRAHMGRIGELV